jgi:hypothetical protein
MYWWVVDVSLGVLAVAVVALSAYGLYRRVRALLRTFGSSSSRIGEAAAALGSPRATAPQRR